MTNFYSELEHAFQAHADKPALVCPSASDWTFAQLSDYVGRAGQVLLDQGVQVGDRVVAQVPKSKENLALYLAVLRIGAVYVPLNTAYTRS